ncbi:hypothetical protein Micbo1qcDRAFT_234628 [Microdochium bolleyi]|uniref:Trichothecene 3-O-acetyltransferase-like N-terminal domain-containing protein n=1 Tax=Microdochium bolleyi TaxID=196109 RepID=A0A136J0M3_9PEZI|nr:hypothetical protein Micbo1qcDRAFT_234628 [Microdochium bolleyi]
MASMWNHFSPRVYVGLALCFPFDDSGDNRVRAERHIRESLDRLARARPHLTDRLHVDSHGFVTSRRCPDLGIPLDVLPHDQITLGNYTKKNDDAGDDYNEHKRAGFPPRLFVDSKYSLCGALSERAAEAVPVARVGLKFVRNGLYLVLHLHHSMFDGCSISTFVECFAAHTRQEQMPTVEYPPEQLFPDPPAVRTSRYVAAQSHGHEGITPDEQVQQVDFACSLSQCPEYTILADRSGPTQPKLDPRAAVSLEQIPRTGKIFVFRNDRLRVLQQSIRDELGTAEKMPSAYTALAALTWAHAARARIRHESYLPPTTTYLDRASQDSTDDQDTSTTVSLWNCYNCRPHMNNQHRHQHQHHHPVQPAESIGTAVLPLVTKLPSAAVLAACGSKGALARRLVPHIQSTIGGVDGAYIRRRQRAMDASPDPRLVGVDYDPRDPAVLHFNTWRHFAGADQAWDIPGVGAQVQMQEQAQGRQADAVRRVHGEWNLGTALVLPAKKGAEVQELFVSLSEDAMMALCEDEEWMGWVDRVVG